MSAPRSRRKVTLTRLGSAALRTRLNAAMVKHLGVPETRVEGAWRMAGAGHVYDERTIHLDYAGSMDTLTPLLQYQHAKVELLPRWARVVVVSDPQARYPKTHSHTASTLPVAGCIALLRAAGVTVVT